MQILAGGVYIGVMLRNISQRQFLALTEQAGCRRNGVASNNNLVG